MAPTKLNAHSEMTIMENQRPTENAARNTLSPASSAGGVGYVSTLLSTLLSTAESELDSNLEVGCAGVDGVENSPLDILFGVVEEEVPALSVG